MVWLDDMLAPRLEADGVESTPRRGIWNFLGALVTDDPAGNRKNITLTVPPVFGLTGILTPPQITSQQNNYNPTGFSEATVLRLSSNARQFLTGIAGGTVGRVLMIQNVGTNTIALAPNNSNSTAANRLHPPRPTNQTEWDLLPGESVWLHYPVDSGGWRVLGLRGEVFGRFTIGYGSLGQDEPVLGRFGANVLKIGHSSGVFRRVGGFDGEGSERERILTIHTGTTPIAFQHEDTSNGTAARRLKLPYDQLFLWPGEALEWQYDATSAGRWVPIFAAGNGFRRASANLTDADQTLTYAGGVEYQQAHGSLTATRNKALGSSGAPAHPFIATIRRFDRSANALNIRNLTTGGTILFTFAANTPGEADFRWDGSTNYAFSGFKPYP